MITWETTKNIASHQHMEGIQHSNALVGETKIKCTCTPQ